MSQSFKALTLLFVTVILALSSCSSDTDDAVPTVRNKALPEVGGEIACPPPKGEKWIGPVDNNGEPICEAPVCPPPKGEKWIGPVDKNDEPICLEGAQDPRLAPPGRFLPNGTDEQIELPEDDPHATVCQPRPCVRGAVDWATSSAPDVVVTAFGDSYASGEGAPFKTRNRDDYYFDSSILTDDPQWAADYSSYEHPIVDPVYCHRSPRSTFARAMVDVHDAFPGVRLAWRSFACSGAVTGQVINESQTILKGITHRTGFEDDPARSWSYRPQFGAAQDWVNSLGEDRQSSIVYLNIGGNDAGFGDAISTCSTATQCHLEDWDRTDERATILNFGRIAREEIPNLLLDLNTALDEQAWFRGDFSQRRWTNGQVVYTVAPNIAFAEGRACGADHDPVRNHGQEEFLRERGDAAYTEAYDIAILAFLSEELAQEAGELARSAARNVARTTALYLYMPGRMSSIPESFLSSAEVDFLWTTIGIPLQASMRSQGAANNWQVVDSDFSEHGICARVPWINNNASAIATQGADMRWTPVQTAMGIWHPNDAGYDAWAIDLAPALIEAVEAQLPADTSIVDLTIDESTVTFSYVIAPRYSREVSSYRERSMNVLTARATCLTGTVHETYAYVFSPSDPDAAGEIISIQPCGDELVGSVILKQVNCFLDNRHDCGDPGRASGEQDEDAPRIVGEDGFLPGIGEDPDDGFEPDEDIDPFG
jgi:hypothetical protein